MNRDESILTATVLTGVSFVTIGLVGSNSQTLQPACYFHDLFVWCLNSNPETVAVHETYWGLVALGAFLLAGCALVVIAGIRWPPRRRALSTSVA